MSKPTAFTWATDANYGAGSDPWSGEPNKVAPVAGLVAEGWTPTEHPAADNLNHMFAGIAAWCAWLNALSVGAATRPVQLTSGGDLIASDDLNVPDDLTVGGDVTVTGTVTASKFVFTGARSQMIPASAASQLSSGGWTFSGFDWTVGDTSYLYFPLVVEDGYQIISFEMYVYKGTNGSTTLLAEVVEIDLATNVITTVNSDTEFGNAPGYTTLNGFTTHDVVAGKQYAIRIASNTGGALDKVKAVKVNFKRLS